VCVCVCVHLHIHTHSFTSQFPEQPGKAGTRMPNHSGFCCCKRWS